MATAYPFDPSGTSAANRITNEQHVITAVNFRDYHYVIPKFAPFFAESLQIKLQYPNGTVRPLTQGLDYYLSHQFMDASRACAKPVYGSISFLDTDTAGILSITYQTVGGIWTLTPEEISRILAEQLRNPRTTTWEQITYLPERFPVVDHEWDLIDMVGAKEIVRAIDDIAETILASNGGGLQQHVTNYANPHNVTKAQVGLGSVQNFGLASQLQAEAGSVNNVYMTPLSTAYAIAAQAGALLYTHSSRTDNPHQTTKAQVGLGSVDNFATATVAEAQAGSAGDRFMTPSLVSAAINFQVGTAFAAHVLNQNNPHNVTKAQVGLFNVENYQVATAEEARAGTRSDRYMTPQRTTQLMAEYVNTRIMEHELRIDNPHEVNKVQIGLGNVQNFGMADISVADNPTSMSLYVSPAVASAIAKKELELYMESSENPSGITKAAIGLGNVENYPIATQLQAEAGTVNTAYMTPLRTAQAISVQASALVLAHSSLTSNPHNTTKSQVGLGNVDNFATATPAQAALGTATNLFVTPAGLKSAIDANLGGSISSHVNDKNNPHEVTASQIGAMTQQDLTNQLGNYLLRTSTDVSAMSREDFIALVLQGTAANAERINGYDSINYANYLIENHLDSVFVPTNHSPAVADTSAMTPTARQAAVTICELSRADFAEADATGNGFGVQEVSFLVHGGQAWNNSILGGVGFTNSSPLFLVTASMANADAAGGNPTVKVTQLAGFGLADANVIEIGHKYTQATGVLEVYLTTTKSHRPVIINRLSSFGSSTATGRLAATYPTGLSYPAIQRGVDNSMRLNGQLAAYYATAQSVTDLGTATNQSIAATNQSISDLATSTTQSFTATAQSLQALDQRITAIENTLNGITVG